MPGIFRSFLDAFAGGALVLALLIVILLDRAEAPPAPTGSDLPVHVLSDAIVRTGAPRLRLAVTPTHRQPDPMSGGTLAWDDMGKLLNELGEGYRFDMVEPGTIAAKPQLL